MTFMKRALSVISVLILIIPIFSIVYADSTYKEKLYPYIIELKKSPIVEYIKQIRNKMFPNILDDGCLYSILKKNISSYRENLIETHEKLKDFILSHLKHRVEIRDFFKVFNGISVSIPLYLKKDIERLPFVKEIYPDLRVHTLLNVSVPLIGANLVWNLRDGHNLTVTGRNVTIAIVDTGVDYNHPDLRGSYAGGYDIINNDTDPMDDFGHGTHVAGIIVGDGTASHHKYVGVAPDAKLYVYKAMDSNGWGRIKDIISGIEMAVDPNGDGDTSDHVDIISLSLGVSHREGDPDDALSQAADNAVDAGCVVVVAAGNDGPSSHTIVSPACARKVITVGASTHLPNSKPSGGPDHIALYSSRGPSMVFSVKPDVVAPGGDVDKNSTDPNTRYAYGIVSTLLEGYDLGKIVSQYYTRLGGTSMAAPHVAGVAALIKQKHPDWSPMEIKMAIRDTAKNLGFPIIEQGYGRVDAFAAVSLSSPPPIAFLYADRKTYDREGSIYGTAMSRNFRNYTLYYKYIGRNVTYIDRFDYSGEWKELYTSSTPVNGGILYNWKTLSSPNGGYLIKLVVRNKDSQESTDMMFVLVDHRELHINVVKNITDGKEFTVTLTNEFGRPVRGMIIYSSPFRFPRIKFGSNVNFVAYPILFRKTKSIDAVIRVFSFFPGYLMTNRTTLIIYNT